MFWWLLRLGLSLVFSAAAIGKSRDRAGTVTAAIGFGLTARLAAVVARVLPPVEAGIAILLLHPSTALGAAWAAMAVLAIFTAMVGWVVVTGRSVACHCFGGSSAAPVGIGTLIRNGVLLGATSVVAAGPAPDGGVWTELDATTLAIIAIVGLMVLGCAQAWWMSQLVRQHGRLLSRIAVLEAAVASGGGTPQVPTVQPDGLPIGSPAPTFSLRPANPVAPAGGRERPRVTLHDVLAAGGPVTLVFTSSGCGACTDALASVAVASGRTVVVASGNARSNREHAVLAGVTDMLLDPKRAVALSYRALATPAAVMVDEDGRIASPLAVGLAQVRSLLADEGPGPAESDHDGQARRLVLRDLAGADQVVGGASQRSGLLLFFDPACGFCQQIVPDLRRHLAGGDTGESQVIVVSRDRKATAALDLPGTVVLDDDRLAFAGFDVPGTPAVIHLDRTGRTSGVTAVGGAAVLAALAARQSAGGRVLQTADSAMTTASASTMTKRKEG